MKQSENIGDFALALSKAQGMLEGAAKTSDNPFFKSKYADLHECIEAAKDALSKNDLAVVQTTDTDESGAIWVYTTMIHKSGQWIQGRLRMKPKKDDDQATGSSITYGRRYGFAAIVGLAQKDDDGNESVKEPEKKGKKLLSADWEKRFDSSCDKNLPAIKTWRAKNGSEILATIANDQEKLKLKKFLDDSEKTYTEILCPETDATVTADTCQGKACRVGCPEHSQK